MPSFHHVHIRSTTPRESARWYVDRLGARLVREFEIRGAPSYELDLWGQRVYVTGEGPGESLPPGSSARHLGLEHIGLQVEDVRGLVEELRSRGVKILDEPSTSPNGTTIAFIEAPDNVRIEILQLPG